MCSAPEVLITGSVSVTLCGGGLGESVILATILPPSLGAGSCMQISENYTDSGRVCVPGELGGCTWRSGWPGKREQVWPSGPAPSSSRSSLPPSLVSSWACRSPGTVHNSIQHDRMSPGIVKHSIQHNKRSYGKVHLSITDNWRSYGKVQHICHRRH